MSYSLVSTMSIVLFLTACLFGRLIQGQVPCSSEDANSIQLNNTGIFSSVQGSGRVEICVCSTDTSCFWQTVSTGSQTVPFSWKNSIVVCRELGFYDVESPILQNSILDIYQAPDSVGIFEHTFLCDGTESHLSDCAQESLSSSNTHQADAYINCQTAEVHGKIRLTGSTTEGQGVVEYYHSTIGNGSWVTVCPDFWLSSESDIFCKSLGYESGSLQKHRRTSFNGPNIETAPGIQSVSCPGSGYYFASCIVTFNGICADVGNLAGVNCVSNNAPDGSARLYQTSDTSVYSRMEVLYGGRWGTVCNIRWTIEDAQVACRELNRDLTGTTIPSFENNFIVANSSRPIWIVGYNCEGGESTLRDCARPSFPVGFPSVSCSHSDDAGLTCGALIIPSKPFPPGGIAGIVIGISVFLIFIFAIVIFAIVIFAISFNHKLYGTSITERRNSPNKIKEEDGGSKEYSCFLAIKNQ